MTPGEQNVKRQYPETVCNDIETNYNGISYHFIWIDDDIMGSGKTPAEAWAEAERNLLKEKEK